MKTEIPKRLYSIQEAAIYLGMEPAAVRDLVYDGILPQVNLGQRKVRIDIRDLDALIMKNKISAAA